MKKIHLIVLFILASLVAIGQKEKDWKSLLENNYSISYPSNWQLDQSGKVGTSFILYSPLSSEKDQFKENVNLLIQDLSGLEMDLDKYMVVSEAQIKKMIANDSGQIIENEKITNADGMPYQKIVYSNKQGDFDLKFEQYYLVQNNKAHILTLNCEESEFNTFQTIGEKILNSFRLK